jgi:hypothetical protein
MKCKLLRKGGIMSGVMNSFLETISDIQDGFGFYGIAEMSSRYSVNKE